MRRVRVDVVDPSAFTPPYDHALCAALARAGAEVELVTSRFAYGPVAAGEGYRVRDDAFYRRALGRPASRLRLAAKLAQHVPDMRRYARTAAQRADVVHFQWLPVQPIDARLLPRGVPLVLTAHDVVPREPRRGQVSAQRRLYERVDAIVVHSHHGRERLITELDVAPEKITVIPHGAFVHLLDQPDERPLPGELATVEGPVVLCFGLLRPYKGVDVLLDAWQGIGGAELWIVGMPRMPLGPLRARAGPNVRFLPRFVTDPEIPAFFRRADLVVLPYRQIDQSGVLFTALAFGRPLLLSAVGGFPDVAETGAAELVAPGDKAALHIALQRLISDPDRRGQLAAAAARVAQTTFGWDEIARRHLELYARLAG